MTNLTRKSDAASIGEGEDAEALAKRLCRLVPALLSLPMRTALLVSEIEARDGHIVAKALDHLASRAEQADPASREVIAALLPMLSDPERQTLIQPLREHAEGAALLSLCRLLRRKQPKARGQDKRLPEARGVSIEPSGRPLSLGERRALARTPTRSILDKLLSDPHPFVIRNLLQNPRLTEDDVVSMAARRPGRLEVLLEIARSPVWMARARVRMAIVLNPATPTEVSVPLLSQLLRSELESVRGSTFVPAVLRASALDLLARRPPAPFDPMGGNNVQ